MRWSLIGGLMGSMPAELILVLTAMGTASLTTAVAYAQRVSYPMISLVPEESFADFHQRHIRRIGPVVAFGFTSSGIGSLLLPFMGFPIHLTIASLAFFAGVGLTTLGAVSAHRNLEAGYKAEAQQRLLSWNRWRLLFGIAHTTILVILLVQ
jgi:hypothetical protein